VGVHDQILEASGPDTPFPDRKIQKKQFWKIARYRYRIGDIFDRSGD
jgi:hypothetical protein